MTTAVSILSYVTHKWIELTPKSHYMLQGQLPHFVLPLYPSPKFTSAFVRQATVFVLMESFRQVHRMTQNDLKGYQVKLVYLVCYYYKLIASVLWVMINEWIKMKRNTSSKAPHICSSSSPEFLNCNHLQWCAGIDFRVPTYFEKSTPHDVQ